MEQLTDNVSSAWQNVADLAVLYGMQVLGAVIILVVGWSVAGWARNGVARMVDRSARIDATLKPLFGSLVRYLVLALTVIAVLSQFGVQTASIIAVLGAAGLAIGLALQGTLQNVAAGVMLLSLRPFRVDDYIDAEGVAGTVVQIGVFTTELRTFDGVYLFVPNSRLWSVTVLNYSRNPTRRLDVTVGVSYADDVEGAMQVLRELLAAEQRVLGEPEPQVMVKALGESSVDINMRCWTAADDYWGLLWDLNRLAKLRIEGAGYSIPFPQRDVHLHGAAAGTSA